MTGKTAAETPDETDGSDRSIERLLVLGCFLVVGGLALLASVAFIVMVFPGGPDPHPLEIDVEYENRVVDDTDSIGVSLVGLDGDPVEDAHVIVHGDTLSVDEPAERYTGEDSNTVRVSIDPDPDAGDLTPDWRAGQERGNLSVDVVPSDDSSYADTLQNERITVLRTTGGT